MSQKWPPATLFPKAELIAHFIGLDQNVTGVAITGSLARFEHARDIDLVVFHNGAFRDGLAHYPQGLYSNLYDSDVLTFSLVPNFRDVMKVSQDVPLDLFFVREEILWDCAYLKFLGDSERSPGFYKTVFCDVPLLLMGVRWGSSLEKFIVKVNFPIRWLGMDNSLSRPFCHIIHTCRNSACKPTVNWARLRAGVEKRKAQNLADSGWY